MGLFSQRQDEENTWAALPGEPRDGQGAADTLDAASAVDPLEVGLSAQVTSIVFPVTPVVDPVKGADPVTLEG